ncbi:hypothetical protein EMIHUDRAFT_211129 [Emiliania huxleyi CCMP1516]|uniref:Uncharacterized protein n=2 Tax=Emiliania huxleyi TaxID=2903 RepID=A0A0D3IWG9_EMIH1|nr:hypothetical protein EMIHUDRAFT_211129 [Emiliania huxleyi CCMP1516]EOD15604.1 hypothetical protein EMIHUDRAFT_211129 [Emiliania huxleyi CCMP1516]|eukprot:XP_005768033.1 hypothetical protein EMIHUDRAFT_211129 [Emiliania huxleyi CCMP1516]
MSFASCTNTSSVATAAGSWSKDADSGFRYHARDCLLVRPSASRVRKCLRHRHLLFVGDSLQRYLYLTLANFLVTGEWPRDLKAGERSPCFEGAYALNKTRDEVWPEYFRGTNSDLRGAEICDCFRTTCCSEAVLNENRYTLFDGAAVSFVSQMVSPGWEVHGSTLPDSWPRMRASTTCTPGECVATSTGRNRPWRIGASANMPDKRWAWSEPLPKFLRTTMPHLGVTDVLFNPGHHYNPDTNLLFMRRVFDSAMRGASHRAWWRTTTPRLRGGLSATSRQGFPLGVKGATSLAHEMGVGVVDVLTMLMQLPRQLKSADWAITEGAFVDGVHLQCSVNRELLIVMLNAICAF